MHFWQPCAFGILITSLTEPEWTLVSVDFLSSSFPHFRSFMTLQGIGGELAFVLSELVSPQRVLG